MNQSMENPVIDRSVDLPDSRRQDHAWSDINLLVKLIKKCVAEDREEDALRIFNSADPIDQLQGSSLLLWAQTAELLGKTDTARRAYEKAMADPAVTAHALKALAYMALESGDCLAAEKLLAEARSKGVSPAVISQIESDMTAAAEDEPDFDPEPLRNTRREQAIQKMLLLFQGKRGVHARQWYDRSRDQTGYVPVEEPLSYDLIAKHLDGTLTLGVYPLLDDNTVFFAALDIDVRKAMVQEFCENPSCRSKLFGEIKACLREIKAWSEARNLPVVFEYSGMKGVHAWYFFEKPLPAGCAISLLQECVRSISSVHGDLNIEIFPRQEAQTGKGYGNLIKLPLGVHRKTGKRSVFLDDSCAAIGDNMPFLLAIKRIPSSLVDELIQKWNEARYAGKVKQIPSALEGSSGCEIQRVHPIIEKCAVINWLVKKAKSERHLTFAERKVLLGVFGHLQGGEKILHDIIRNCADYSPQITDHYISKLKGTPLGCNKIRRLLFYLEGIVECACAFTENGDYASPVNHFTSAQPANDHIARPSLPDVASLVAEIAKLRADLNEIRNQIGWKG